MLFHFIAIMCLPRARQVGTSVWRVGCRLEMQLVMDAKVHTESWDGSKLCNSVFE